MSRSLGARLPDAMARLLDGTDPEGGQGFTVSLITADEAGWPRVALLSVGELVALDERRLGLALWPGTTSTRLLTANGRATLACVIDRVAYSVHASFRRGDDLRAGGMGHAYFEGQVEETLEDVVTYARLTHGVEFELPEPEAVLPRWRATIAAVRERAGVTPAADPG